MTEANIPPGTALVGVSAPVVGTTVSLISSLEAWFRLGSVVVGFIIGVLALYRMLKHPPKDKE